jgi:hypothetical protein
MKITVSKVSFKIWWMKTVGFSIELTCVIWGGIGWNEWHNK